MVNFRVSEDELYRMREYCKLTKVRSISDFARNTVLEHMDNANSPKREEPTVVDGLAAIAYGLESIAQAINTRRIEVHVKQEER